MAGWLTGQRDAYEYLGGSIEAFPSASAMLDLLESCGYLETPPPPADRRRGLASISQPARP
jgi:demethylmenaquinone methyltransferase / 2-methoxy-6-polyprenyl-1,4-benzoquinol methylase